MAETNDAGSPWAVALDLAKLIANREGKPLSGSGPEKADRAYILTLYKECLAAVAAEGPFVPH